MMNDNYLKHYGIVGMHWGSRRGQKKIDKLVTSVDKSIKKFDAGSRRVGSGTFKEHSRKARRLTYKANKRIAKMNKYLNSTKGESVNNLLLKWKKDPEKVAKVKDLLARNEMQTKRLSELRSSLMDVKLDLI